MSMDALLCLPAACTVGRGDYAVAAGCNADRLRNYCDQGLVGHGHWRLGSGVHRCRGEHRLGRQFRGKLGLRLTGVTWFSCVTVESSGVDSDT